MKYIRTKGGVIYKVLDDGITREDAIRVSTVNCFGDILGVEPATWIDKKVILKQADTIEELCDCFIDFFPKYKGNDIIGYEHDFWYYSKEEKCFYNMIDNQSLDLNDFDNDFKGAIWTSKGLIYVAEKNSEGGLCLI